MGDTHFSLKKEQELDTLLSVHQCCFSKKQTHYNYLNRNINKPNSFRMFLSSSCVGDYLTVEPLMTWFVCDLRDHRLLGIKRCRLHTTCLRLAVTDAMGRPHCGWFWQDRNGCAD